jgi:hypothetical protein
MPPGRQPRFDSGRSFGGARAFGRNNADKASPQTLIPCRARWIGFVSLILADPICLLGLDSGCLSLGKQICILYVHLRPGATIDATNHAKADHGANKRDDQAGRF